MRTRGFAFLPKKFGGWGRERLVAGGVAFHAAEKSGAEAKADEAANWKSCITLRPEDVTPAARDALAALLADTEEVLATFGLPLISVDAPPLLGYAPVSYTHLTLPTKRIV